MYTSRTNPMSLSGGIGFQSTKVMPRSFSGQNSYRQRIESRNGDIRDVELEHAIHAANLVGSGDLTAVEPDVRTVVDGIEIQPQPLFRRYSKAKEPGGRLPAAGTGSDTTRRPQTGYPESWED